MGFLSDSKSWLDVLFTRTQRQLLGLFFGRPDCSFHLNEVVRRAGVGTGAVQRELARLSGAGLLSVRRVGNQKRYRANPDAPIFPELCGIVRKTIGAAEVLRAALKELRPLPERAILYRDAGDPVYRVLLVSDRLSPAAVGSVLFDAGQRLGREFRPWLLDRRRYDDLLGRKDPRLLHAQRGQEISLAGITGSSQPG